MKAKRTVCAAISAFFITTCVLLAVGGLWIADQRTGQVLFGSAYEQTVVTTPVVESQARLPARLRVAARFIQWEIDLLEQIF